MGVLDYKSKNFSSVPPKASGQLSISSSKLCWAAITVGRPGKAAVKSFGQYSVFEALYRWNMVRAALEVDSPSCRFRNSNLFDALDPTEKGGVNFYLGMIFAKIAAQDLLGIPWLVHFGTMTKNHYIPKSKGKSSPDLLGYSCKTKKWNVFEAKGKVGGYSKKLMKKAKDQANNLTTVDGNPCGFYVGTQLYRNSVKQLEFAWEDPPPDENNPIALATNRDLWRRYYAVAYSIYKAQTIDDGAISASLGFKIGFAPEAMDFIRALEDPKVSFANEFGRLSDWSAARHKEPDGEFQLDGIAVRVHEST